MARFRLFGRAPAPDPPSPPTPPAYGPPYGPPPGWGPPPVGAGAPTTAPPGWPAAGPATRAARPAVPRPVPTADPPTDPHGFPPIPGPRSAAPTPPWPRPPAPAPEPAEAAALAGAFAVDYLSWDEDDPGRRGRVLLDYLPAPGRDPDRLGWSGRGRQRAEFALPGRVRPDGEGRVLVDVRVRVTPYRAVGDHGPEPAAATEPEPGIAGIPAAAPAPTGRGWRSLASYWIRLSVPVVLENGRLVVDAWEETLGEVPEPPPAGPPAPDDHTLADDDPLAEPRSGTAW
ncbi:hypothetical protein [Pseudonocardia nigra]|uniref:hypothetical protein n=1 Tax=Pseudonocardia nigra TaxID=1921578 RepID=UPI001C5ECD82|nr:hypothetical protein [Pseudonocardia nigra]